MNSNRATRSTVTKMVKDGKEKSTNSLSMPSASSDNPNKKRSREDLSQIDEETDSFDRLLDRIREMIDEGNTKLEKKIDSTKKDVVAEISSLRNEMNQLKIDHARDFQGLSEVQSKLAEEVRKNKDMAGKLLKSNDLILTGVPYCSDENTDDMLLRVAAALGYGESNIPLVFTKRLARAPIAAGSTPPILFQFAFRAAKDEFFQRYFAGKKLSLLHLGFAVDRRIYFNENLTESARNLKGAALKMKRSGHIRNVFSRDGTIFVKPLDDIPPQPIFELNQLAVFGNKQT